MDNLAQQHLKLKILVGSAWVDGVMEPSEIEYLRQQLTRYDEQHDAELKRLLNRPVPLAQTETWLVQYLQQSTDAERQELLGAVGTLLFADREIAEAEHELIDEFYLLMNRIPAQVEPPELVKTVGRAVRSVVQRITSRE